VNDEEKDVQNPKEPKLSYNKGKEVNIIETEVPANQNRLTINGNNINKKEPAETEY
jgi:hypothetical protein